MRRDPYSLHKPCANCPFRTDIEPFLRRARAREIVRDIERGEFICHKTIDYENRRNDEGEKVCAGSLIMQEKSGRIGQMTRICERLGMYDRSLLDMDAPVFATPTAFVRAQGSSCPTPRKPRR